VDVTTIVNIIGGICGIGGLLFGICSTWFILRQVAFEHTSREVERARMSDHVETLQVDLKTAYDKIRDIEIKDNETSRVITRIEANLEENTRVLRRVEDLLSTTAKIEQKLDSHISESRR